MPWLHFVGFGRGEDKCWIIYKPIRWKRLPCAWVMHVSHPGAFDRQEHLLRRHLLFRGLVVMCIEARWLAAAPPFAIDTRRGQPKLFLSPTLVDRQVRDLYSELMSLDV